MIYIFVLEYDTRYAGFDTYTAVSTLFLDNDIGAIFPLINRSLGAYLHTFTALGADFGLIDSRLRKLSLDSQSGLLGIDPIEMTDSADLGAETAAAAFSHRDFYSFLFHDAPDMNCLIHLTGDPDYRHQHNSHYPERCSWQADSARYHQRF
jgi:hypothetical protein